MSIRKSLESRLDSFWWHFERLSAHTLDQIISGAQGKVLGGTLSHLLRLNNSLLAINMMPSSIGHMLPEYENLLHMGPMQNHGKLVLIVVRRHTFSRQLIKLLRPNKNILFIQSSLLAMLIERVCCFVDRKYLISPSISHLLHEEGYYQRLCTQNAYSGRVDPYNERVRNYVFNNSNRQRTSLVFSSQSIKKAHNVGLNAIRDLGLLNQKFLVLQYKAKPHNGVLDIYSNAEILSAFHTARAHGFEIVVIGGALPHELHNSGLIDYWGIIGQSLVKDMGLMMHSSHTLIIGSGLGYLPDILGLPYSFINCFYPYGLVSTSARVYPSRLHCLETNRLLTIDQQYEIFKKYYPADLSSVAKSFRVVKPDLSKVIDDVCSSIT